MSSPESEQVAPGIDLEHPSVARVYDYYLGGSSNWAIDREFAKRILTEFPQMRAIALANRLFGHRVIRHLARLGVRQFVDIGAGVPTLGATHQVAEELAPGSRVIYVDNEPVAVAHSQLLVDQYGEQSRHASINADLRNPEQLWQRVRQTRLLDFDEPIAVLVIAVLHMQQPGPDGAESGQARWPAAGN